MFFEGWAPLGRILVVGTLAYVCLILVLRVSGKRTLAKMNAFDFVVTVALGSTLATIILSKDTSLAGGVLALGLLIGLQYLVAFGAQRTEWLGRVVKSEPALLFRRGEYLDGALRRERVTREEVQAAIRSNGQMDAHDVEAVVLETDGSFSVLASSASPPRDSTLGPVQGTERTPSA